MANPADMTKEQMAAKAEEERRAMAVRTGLTYPPEMLPVADGPAEVIVVDPVTGAQTVVNPFDSSVVSFECTIPKGVRSVSINGGSPQAVTPGQIVTVPLYLEGKLAGTISAVEYDPASSQPKPDSK